RSLQAYRFVFDSRYDLLVLLSILEEVGNIEEGVALQTDVDEGRLHPRQNLRHLPFIDVADYALRTMPFDVVLDEFVILEYGEFGFLCSRGNDQLFLHRRSCAEPGRMKTQVHAKTRGPQKNHGLSWKLLCPEEQLRGFTPSAQLCAAAL